MIMPRIHCHNCRTLIGFNLSWISGDIGPSVYKCRSCEDVMSSDRSEWLWHGRDQKTRYKTMSLVIAIVYGLACASALTCLIDGIAKRLPDTRMILVMFAAAASTTVFIQWLRVMISVFRDSRGDIRPLKVGFFSFETNSILPFLLPPAVAALTYYYVAPLI